MQTTCDAARHRRSNSKKLRPARSADRKGCSNVGDPNRGQSGKARKGA